jgi:tetratricopeptide (TPR) repeat protein
LERLGRRRDAIDVYSQAIAGHPRDGELFMARGLALYGEDLPKALADLVMAVRLGVAALSPYLLLAQHAFQQGAFGEALRLALAAEHQPGTARARAVVYATIAMALAELGQPHERVLENFDTALALDPTNESIRENRAIAAALARQSPSGRTQRRRLVKALPISPGVLREARSDQIRNRLELLNEQRQSRIGERLVSV